MYDDDIEISFDNGVGEPYVGCTHRIK